VTASPGADRAAPTAVLLCAGRGARLAPLTDVTPKALVPVGGRPLLDHQLEELRAAGVHDLVVVTGHLGDRIRDHLGDGRALGFEIHYVEQDPPLGTGDAMRRAMPHVRTDPFLLGYTDLYVSPLERLWSRMRRDDRPKIAATWVDNAGRYGRLTVRSEDGTVADLIEKDGQATPGWANRGFYMLPRAIEPYLARLSPSPRGELEFTEALAAYVRAGGPLGILSVSRIVSIGDEVGLAEANRAYALEGRSAPRAR
jgi:NDP-sugar pyrophosphorylase family protein